MSITLESSVESGCLYVSATGDYSLEEAKRIFVKILEAVAQHKVEKVLFDGRKLAGNPQTMERYDYAVFAVDEVRRFMDCGVSLITQFAYVLKEPMLEPGKFGENVLVNRGIFTKSFDNTDDALEWLKIKPANNPDTGGSK